MIYQGRFTLEILLDIFLHLIHLMRLFVIFPTNFFYSCLKQLKMIKGKRIREKEKEIIIFYVILLFVWHCGANVNCCCWCWRYICFIRRRFLIDQWFCNSTHVWKILRPVREFLYSLPRHVVVKWCVCEWECFFVVLVIVYSLYKYLGNFIRLP